MCYLVIKLVSDHQVDAIYDGMYAVGNTEEAQIFKDTYQDLRDTNKLREASDLVDQGASIIDRHTMGNIHPGHKTPFASEALHYY